MIRKQLNQYNLYNTKNCFLFDGKVYERLSKNPYSKYRFILGSDDYDYVVDQTLKKQLDKFLKDNKFILSK